MSDAALRVDKARWWALTEQPFYGSLAMNLPDAFDTSIETAATDGRSIRWSADYVNTLTNEELRFVLLHETLHCAHQHLWRLPTDQRGNVAGDHEINLTLAGIPGIKMPQGGLADPQYKGMACEEILAALPDEQDGDQGAGKPDPCGSFTEPGEGAPGDGSESVREDWTTAVVQAVQAAQASGKGDIPGDMARQLERIRHTPIDWRQEMADFVRDAVAMRNDWSRAARRHAWQSVIYPRKRADDFGTVVFARDSSGSVSDRDCAEYSALITDCLSELGCSGLVLDCDTRIQAEYDLAPGDECPLSVVGGGGTNFCPVFDRADEMIAAGEQIAGIVYLTDMGGRMPESSSIPTLWLATSDRVAPFGRTVRIGGM